VFQRGEAVIDENVRIHLSTLVLSVLSRWLTGGEEFPHINEKFSLPKNRR